MGQVHLLHRSGAVRSGRQAGGEGRRRCRIVFCPPIAVPRTANREADLTWAMGRVATAVEGAVRAAWDAARCFHADPRAAGDMYAIFIPPPNVTGSLHMGHAFNTALIDTIVRFQRLQGKNVLCLPGTDHASIAVQTILEKQLKAEGKRKEDLGREAFLEKAWEWKAQSGGTIVGQLRRLGYSVDWRRERFTLDAGCSTAVIEAFNRLHEQGLIYRGEYLVNWCPASGSAVSDLEVEMKEVDGHLWHFRYPLSVPAADGRTHLEVATTRPETLLGDTAVAVNPKDPRYADLVDQTLSLPLVGREIPIVADDHVDAEFGTGCVKVTPAHDPNDFAIGQRHNLPLITVMAKDGSMNEAAGRFQGLDRFEARQAVVASMEAEGFLVKVEDYRHSVPFSDRGKVPVEPLLSTQWFVKTEPLAARCRDGGHCFCCTIIDIADQYGCAGIGKCNARCPANAGRPPRNQDRLTRKNR